MNVLNLNFTFPNANQEFKTMIKPKTYGIIDTETMTKEEIIKSLSTNAELSQLDNDNTVLNESGFGMRAGNSSFTYKSLSGSGYGSLYQLYSRSYVTYPPALIINVDTIPDYITLNANHTNPSFSGGSNPYRTHLSIAIVTNSNKYYCIFHYSTGVVEPGSIAKKEFIMLPYNPVAYNFYWNRGSTSKITWDLVKKYITNIPEDEKQKPGKILITNDIRSASYLYLKKLEFGYN